MAMVMANMVTAMARISYKFIAAFSLASLGFVSGCQKDYSVTAEDAEEVVLDDSGFSKKDVDDLNTEENSSGFNVEFNAKKTHFIYSVSKKGIIQNREIIREDEGSEDHDETEDSNGRNETDHKLESDNEQTSGDEAADEEQQNEEQNQRAVELALANAGLSRDDVTDLHVSREGDLILVRFRYGMYMNVCRIDPREERVISTFFE